MEHPINSFIYSLVLYVIGHKIVAQIAMDLLSSNANNVVQEYEGKSSQVLSLLSG